MLHVTFQPTSTSLISFFLLGVEISHDFCVFVQCLHSLRVERVIASSILAVGAVASVGGCVPTAVIRRRADFATGGDIVSQFVRLRHAAHAVTGEGFQRLRREIHSYCLWYVYTRLITHFYSICITFMYDFNALLQLKQIKLTDFIWKTPCIRPSVLPGKY